MTQLVTPQLRSTTRAFYVDGIGFWWTGNTQASGFDSECATTERGGHVD